MTNNRKKFVLIALFFGGIVCFANICGLLIPDHFIVSFLLNRAGNQWPKFLDDYCHVIHRFEYLTFVVPSAICVLYTFCPDEKIDSRLINLPIIYSAVGISGWLTYFVQVMVLIVIAKGMGYEFNAGNVFFCSTLSASLESITTFTMSYFIMESLHRKVFLPRIFPNGQISRIKGVIKPGVKLLFFAIYMSVTFFPIYYLSLAFMSYGYNRDQAVDVRLYYTFPVILVIGFVIYLSFERYFEHPLAKFKDRINRIKAGDYKSKVSIVTNDSFGELGDIFNEMTDSIDEKTCRIIEIQNSIITGMATMVESRDNSTGGHIKRTSDCVKVFVNRIRREEKYASLPESFYSSIIKAAPMHDLGKIAVDDAVLRKPGKFTDEEYEKMKMHSQEGARIVENVLSAVDDGEFKKVAVNVAHYHHEKWNGQGYPSGLSGEDIPLEARIMALADVFDALVSKRCYKDSFTYDRAFEIIEESLGSHFDPELGRLFIDCRNELEEMYVLFNGATSGESAG